MTVSTDDLDTTNIAQTTSVTTAVTPGFTNATTETDTTPTTTATTSSTSTTTKTNTTLTTTDTHISTSATTKTDTTLTTTSIASSTTTTTLISTTTAETSTAITSETIQDITSDGSASHSTTDGLYGPEKAVDGKTYTSARTQPTDSQPYFRLSFIGRFSIKYVELIYGTISNDYFALHILVGTNISIPSSGSSSSCGVTSSNHAGSWETVTCADGGKIGNRVFIVSSGIIKLNEVKVYGIKQGSSI